MKNYLFITFFSVLLFSCANEENFNSAEQEYTPKNISKEQLEIRNKVIPLHSQGLDFLFNNIATSKTRVNSEVDKANLIYSETEKFMSLTSTNDIIIKYSSEGKLTRTITEESDEETLKRLSVLLGYIDEFALECDGNNMLENIDIFMGKENIKTLNDYDKAILFYSLSIYEDSYAYWNDENNLSKWICISGKENFKTRGFWDTVLSYAIADAKGAVVGGVAFGCAGAIAGGIAGVGAGAVAGAAAGAISGAVGCAIYESAMEALSDEFVESEDAIEELEESID